MVIFIDLIVGYSDLIHTHISSTGIQNGQILAIIAEDVVRATGAHTDRSVVVEPAKTLYVLGDIVSDVKCQCNIVSYVVFHRHMHVVTIREISCTFIVCI